MLQKKVDDVVRTVFLPLRPTPYLHALEKKLKSRTRKEKKRENSLGRQMGSFTFSSDIFFPRHRMPGYRKKVLNQHTCQAALHSPPN